jgi:hypothetical protein
VPLLRPSWLLLGGLFLGGLALAACNPEPAAPDAGPSAVPVQPGANGEPPPGPGGGLPQCKIYENTEVYGYCVTKSAGGFRTVEDVERLCATAGDWEEECRHAWVAGRMHADSGVSTDVLLEVCGANDDCRFELLDFRPEDDVLIQMDLCRKHAGKHAPDCVGHAMQRWWQAGVDQAEIDRVAAAPTPYPNKVGFWIGVSVGCYGIGACPDDGQTGDFCRSTVENLSRNKNRCPTRSKKPLAHNRDRGPSGAGNPPSGSARPGTPGGRTPPKPRGKAPGRPPGKPAHPRPSPGG